MRRWAAVPCLLATAVTLLALPGVAIVAWADAMAVPRLAVDPPSFDFGSALPGKSLHKEFVLRNIGGAPLVIDKVSTTCGCTVATGYETRIPPGGRTVLRVTFTTPARPPGRTEKSVLVRSNDGEKPIFEIKVAATVVTTPPRPR